MHGIALLVRAYGMGTMVEVLKKLIDVFEPGETVFTVMKRYKNEEECMVEFCVGNAVTDDQIVKIDVHAP